MKKQLLTIILAAFTFVAYSQDTIRIDENTTQEEIFLVLEHVILLDIDKTIDSSLVLIKQCKVAVDENNYSLERELKLKLLDCLFEMKKLQTNLAILREAQLTNK